jgi:hypothetical protein
VSEWDAPSEDRGPADPDADEAAIQSGLSVARPVAVVMSFAGLTYAGNLLQIVLFAWRQSPGIVAGEVFAGLLTLAFFVVGMRVYEASLPFALAGASLGLLGGLFCAIWFTVLVLGGTFTPMPVVAGVASGVSTVACLVLVPYASRVAAARRRLG